MNNLSNENKFFQAIEDLKLWKKSRLRNKLNFVFGKTCLNGKDVLEIGGGTGIMSLYAGSKGAKKVINLEPELEGSSKDLLNSFYIIKEKTGIDNVDFIEKTFQEYDSKEKFDIIIMHDSINHLNEDACIVLKKDPGARQLYKEYFKKLYGMTKEDARMIICDCSSKNFFNDIGLKSPIASNIEWEKHQTPSVWLDLLLEEGFEKERLKWYSFNRLGNWGNKLIGNEIFAYLLGRNFCIHVIKRK